jgi:uncharacterized protein (DUF433 family)
MFDRPSWTGETAMLVEPLLERIELDPEVMLGKPVIRGTRITVEIVLEKIAAGCPIEEVLADYPRLTRDDVLAAVAYARQAIGTDEFIPRVRDPRAVVGQHRVGRRRKNPS